MLTTLKKDIILLLIKRKYQKKSVVKNLCINRLVVHILYQKNESFIWITFKTSLLYNKNL